MYYDGNFKGGEKDGFGVFIWKNGDYYSGNWSNHRRNGWGLMHYAESGERFEGLWLNDIPLPNDDSLIYNLGS